MVDDRQDSRTEETDVIVAADVSVILITNCPSEATVADDGRMTSLCKEQETIQRSDEVEQKEEVGRTKRQARKESRDHKEAGTRSKQSRSSSTSHHLHKHHHHQNDDKVALLLTSDLTGHESSRSSIDSSRSADDCLAEKLTNQDSNQSVNHRSISQQKSGVTLVTLQVKDGKKKIKRRPSKQRNGSKSRTRGVKFDLLVEEAAATAATTAADSKQHQQSQQRNSQKKTRVKRVAKVTGKKLWKGLRVSCKFLWSGLILYAKPFGSLDFNAARASWEEKYNDKRTKKNSTN